MFSRQSIDTAVNIQSSGSSLVRHIAAHYIYPEDSSIVNQSSSDRLWLEEQGLTIAVAYVLWAHITILLIPGLPHMDRISYWKDQEMNNDENTVFFM